MKHQYACIVGSHPELSLAELIAVFESQELPVTDVQLKHSVALVACTEPLDAAALMERLGGTVKIVEIIGEFDEEAIADWLIEQADPTSKFHFGFSLYALSPEIKLKKHWKHIKTLGLALKKSFKNAEVSSRFVESKEVQLSSVIVHKERLLKNGVEIVLLKDTNSIVFGKTLAVQPFQKFSKRDYGRPQRDVRAGMLPPKVARMMINLAQPTEDSTILDPFCGSGTVLQEALLLGYSQVIGSDISRKAVTDTKKNLQWLDLPPVPIHASRAELLVQNGIIHKQSVDRIIFEGHLGPPTPHPKQIPSIEKELQQLYAEVFKEFRAILAPNGVIVAALPFWYSKNQEHHLPIKQIISNGGFSLQRPPLLYRRPQQSVGREIIIAQ